MKNSLLICIAFHYIPDRLQYLVSILNNFIDNYKVSLKIIIDTNVDYLDLSGSFSGSSIEITPHTELEHPFHLTWMHRKHIKENIDNYDNFMYAEDDELIPFSNYISYIEKFKMMWPQYVPSFVRIEKKDGLDYISDVPIQQDIKSLGIIEIEGRKFVSFPFPLNYCGMWCMPQSSLKETIKDNFVRMDDGREFAASYTNWEIGKKPLIEVYEKNRKWFISPDCYLYHLPNNYALSEGTPNGKIKIENVFI